MTILSENATGTRRILCVTSNLPRWEGDSTTPFVLHLAQDLQLLGWEVDILAPHAPGAANAETLGGVRIERFHYLWPESQQTVCYQGGALINLRKNPINKLKVPALVAAECAAIAQCLIKRNYDILHSHWILPQGFTGMIARHLKHIPHVVTVHGGDIFGLKGSLMTKAKRIALRSASAVTVNSSVTERAVLNLAPDLSNVHRIPMGVSTAELDADQIELATDIKARYRRGAGPLLLFLGRLVEEKGVEDLLHAVALLRRELPDATALIVGEGQERDSMERLAARLGLGDHVTFTGWVDPQASRAYLSAADIFVGPSRQARNGWVEGQGLTFLEAMAAKTPVVATRLGGIVDSVQHEQTGLLVDERSPEQIAKSVLRIIADPNSTGAMTKRAHRYVNQHFSRGASAGSFSALFQHLCRQN